MLVNTYTGEAVPQIPEMIIVGMGVAGWVGQPNDAQLPAQMLVDYVRVYQNQTVGGKIAIASVDGSETIPAITTAGGTLELAANSENPVRWSVTNLDGSPTALASISPQSASGQSATLTAIGNGQVKVKAQVDNGLGDGSGYVDARIVTIGGQPDLPDLSVTTTVDDTDGQISFTGGTWGTLSSDSAIGGFERYADAQYAVATLNFTGVGIEVIGSKGPDYGKADIYIDGSWVGSFDGYASEAQMQQSLYAIDGLSNGPHKLEVLVLAQNNPPSSGNVVRVDAINVTSMK
jgi:hypothetical protein